MKLISLPIIALTAEVGSTVKEEAMKCGCSTLINKPANAKDIIACIASIRNCTNGSYSCSHSSVNSTSSSANNSIINSTVHSNAAATAAATVSAATNTNPNSSTNSSVIGMVGVGGNLSSGRRKIIQGRDNEMDEEQSLLEK